MSAVEEGQVVVSVLAVCVTRSYLFLFAFIEILLDAMLSEMSLLIRG